MKKITFIMILILGMAIDSYPAGKWEFGFHYSSWSLNLIKSNIEKNFNPDLELYDPEKGNFKFDSNGNNLGFDLRYFPGGKNGSFSIGVSYERNNFKANINGAYTDHDNAGNRLEAEAKGTMDVYPHSFNLSFRWDLWPSSRVHPYIGIGVGMGALNGTFVADTKATLYHSSGATQTETAHEEKTLRQVLDEMEEEGDKYPLSFFPIVHIQFGLRGEIINNLYLLGEVAVYDGIIFRGGIAYRF
ncbi:MAG: hypothetical protein NT166_14510 [Candidatus Aminicenantes bacterium]|nr:hypothetical protein [Candidatus Aminicenantes bacterium]